MGASQGSEGPARALPNLSSQGNIFRGIGWRGESPSPGSDGSETGTAIIDDSRGASRGAAGASPRSEGAAPQHTPRRRTSGHGHMQDSDVPEQGVEPGGQPRASRRIKTGPLGREAAVAMQLQNMDVVRDAQQQVASKGATQSKRSRSNLPSSTVGDWNTSSASALDEAGNAQEEEDDHQRDSATRRGSAGSNPLMGVFAAMAPQPSQDFVRVARSSPPPNGSAAQVLQPSPFQSALERKPSSRSGRRRSAAESDLDLPSTPPSDSEAADNAPMRAAASAHRRSGKDKRGDGTQANVAHVGRSKSVGAFAVLPGAPSGDGTGGGADGDAAAEGNFRVWKSRMQGALRSGVGSGEIMVWHPLHAGFDASETDAPSGSILLGGGDVRTRRQSDIRRSEEEEKAEEEQGHKEAGHRESNVLDARPSRLSNVGEAMAVGSGGIGIGVPLPGLGAPLRPRNGNSGIEQAEIPRQHPPLQHISRPRAVHVKQSNSLRTLRPSPMNLGTIVDLYAVGDLIAEVEQKQREQEGDEEEAEDHKRSENGVEAAANPESAQLLAQGQQQPQPQPLPQPQVSAQHASPHHQQQRSQPPHPESSRSLRAANLYALLHLLPQDASLEAVRAQYLALSNGCLDRMRRNTSDFGAKRLFDALALAYHVLSSPVLRERYDTGGREALGIVPSGVDSKIVFNAVRFFERRRLSHDLPPALQPDREQREKAAQGEFPRPEGRVGGAGAATTAPADPSRSSLTKAGRNVWPGGKAAEEKGMEKTKQSGKEVREDDDEEEASILRVSRTESHHSRSVADDEKQKPRRDGSVSQKPPQQAQIQAATQLDGALIDGELRHVLERSVEDVGQILAKVAEQERAERQRELAEDAARLRDRLQQPLLSRGEQRFRSSTESDRNSTSRNSSHHHQAPPPPLFPGFPESLLSGFIGPPWPPSVPVQTPSQHRRHHSHSRSKSHRRTHKSVDLMPYVSLPPPPREPPPPLSSSSGDKQQPQPRAARVPVAPMAGASPAGQLHAAGPGGQAIAPSAPSHDEESKRAATLPLPIVVAATSLAPPPQDLHKLEAREAPLPAASASASADDGVIPPAQPHPELKRSSAEGDVAAAAGAAERVEHETEEDGDRSDDEEDSLVIHNENAKKTDEFAGEIRDYVDQASKKTTADGAVSSPPQDATMEEKEEGGQNSEGFKTRFYSPLPGGLPRLYSEGAPLRQRKLRRNSSGWWGASGDEASTAAEKESADEDGARKSRGAPNKETKEQQRKKRKEQQRRREARKGRGLSERWSFRQAADERGGASNAAVAELPSNPSPPPPSSPFGHVRKLRLEDFDLSVVLGRGTYGTVYRGSHLQAPGQEVAVKVLDVTSVKDDPPLMKFALSTFETEITVLKGCSHPNIVSFFGSGGPDKEKRRFLALEYCDGGSLADVMRDLDTPEQKTQLTEEQIRHVCFCLLHALGYLHSKNVCHLDVKSLNVLVTTSGLAKLADFGTCRELRQRMSLRDVLHNPAGSPLWMAPEIIARRPPLLSSDVWSLGITLLELAEGEPPRYSQLSLSSSYGSTPQVNALRAMAQITRSPPPKLSDESRWSPEFRDFLQKCLAKKPEDRSTVLELLSHPWMESAFNPAALASLVERVQSLRRQRKHEADDDAVPEQEQERTRQPPPDQDSKQNEAHGREMEAEPVAPPVPASDSESEVPVAPLEDRVQNGMQRQFSIKINDVEASPLEASRRAAAKQRSRSGSRLLQIKPRHLQHEEDDSSMESDATSGTNATSQASEQKAPVTDVPAPSAPEAAAASSVAKEAEDDEANLSDASSAVTATTADTVTMTDAQISKWTATLPQVVSITDMKHAMHIRKGLEKIAHGGDIYHESTEKQRRIRLDRDTMQEMLEKVRFRTTSAEEEVKGGAHLDVARNEDGEAVGGDGHSRSHSPVRSMSSSTSTSDAQASGSRTEAAKNEGAGAIEQPSQNAQQRPSALHMVYVESTHSKVYHRSKSCTARTDAPSSEKGAAASMSPLPLRFATAQDLTPCPSCCGSQPQSAVPETQPSQGAQPTALLLVSPSVSRASTVSESPEISETDVSDVAEAAANPDDPWRYVDDDGNVQGPFSAAHMRFWAADGYFTEETLVKRDADESSDFLPLGQHPVGQVIMRRRRAAGQRAEPTEPSERTEEPEKSRDDDVGKDEESRTAEAESEDERQGEESESRVAPANEAEAEEKRQREKANRDAERKAMAAAVAQAVAEADAEEVENVDEDGTESGDEEEHKSKKAPKPVNAPAESRPRSSGLLLSVLPPEGYGGEEDEASLLSFVRLELQSDGHGSPATSLRQSKNAQRPTVGGVWQRTQIAGQVLEETAEQAEDKKRSPGASAASKPVLRRKDSVSLVLHRKLEREVTGSEDIEAEAAPAKAAQAQDQASPPARKEVGRLVLIGRDGRDGAAFPLSRHCVIGSDPEVADVLMAKSDVANRHVQLIVRADGAVHLEVLAGRNTFLRPAQNDGDQWFHVLRSQSIVLDSGDHVRISDRQFRFESFLPRPSRPPTSPQASFPEQPIASADGAHAAPAATTSTPLAHASRLRAPAASSEPEPPSPLFPSESSWLTGDVDAQAGSRIPGAFAARQGTAGTAPVLHVAVPFSPPRTPLQRQMSSTALYAELQRSMHERDPQRMAQEAFLRLQESISMIERSITSGRRSSTSTATSPKMSPQTPRGSTTSLPAAVPAASTATYELPSEWRLDFDDPFERPSTAEMQPQMEEQDGNAGTVRQLPQQWRPPPLLRSRSDARAEVGERTQVHADHVSPPPTVPSPEGSRHAGAVSAPTSPIRSRSTQLTGGMSVYAWKGRPQRGGTAIGTGRGAGSRVVAGRGAGGGPRGLQSMPSSPSRGGGRGSVRGRGGRPQQLPKTSATLRGVPSAS